MVPVSRDPPLSALAGTSSASSSSSPASAIAPTPMETTEKKEELEVEKGETSVIKGDPEVAPIYVRHLVPVFTEVFHVTMISSVR